VHQAEQRLQAPTVVCNGTGTMNSVHCTRRSQSRRQKAHRTVNSDCPVHHRTVPVAHLSEAPTVRTQRPSDVVGAPDCPVRHATAGFTNGYFGGWGYKYPQPPTIHCIQVFSLQTLYKSYNIQYKTQTKRSNPLPSLESLQLN
jgi:hypothetical protein